jgi:hypothetical protein
LTCQRDDVSGSEAAGEFRGQTLEGGKPFSAHPASHHGEETSFASAKLARMIRVSGVLIGVISGVVSAVIAALVEAFFFFQRVITFGANGGNWGAGLPKVALIGAVVGAIVGVLIGWLLRPRHPQAH